MITNEDCPTLAIGSSSGIVILAQQVSNGHIRGVCVAQGQGRYLPGDTRDDWLPYSFKPKAATPVELGVYMAALKRAWQSCLT
jgi:hypothetical protein